MSSYPAVLSFDLSVVQTGTLAGQTPTMCTTTFRPTSVVSLMLERSASGSYGGRIDLRTGVPSIFGGVSNDIQIQGCQVETQFPTACIFTATGTHLRCEARSVYEQFFDDKGTGGIVAAHGQGVDTTTVVVDASVVGDTVAGTMTFSISGKGHLATNAGGLPVATTLRGTPAVVPFKVY